MSYMNSTQYNFISGETIKVLKELEPVHANVTLFQIKSNSTIIISFTFFKQETIALMDSSEKVKKTHSIENEVSF